MSSPMPSSRIFLLLFAFLGITFSPSIAFFNVFSYAFFAHLSSPLRLPWHHLHLLWHLLHLPWHLLRLLWHHPQHHLLLELLHHLPLELLLPLLLYPLLLLRELLRQHQHHQQELPHQRQQELPHQHQQVHFQQLQHHFHL